MVYESQYYGLIQIDTGPYLEHHGILGQKWGKQNGPPYPLGSGDHSAAERKAGWRRSLNTSRSGDSIRKKRYAEKKSRSNKTETQPTRLTKKEKDVKEATSKSDNKTSFHLTEEQVKALKISAAVAGTGVAAYGAYKLSQNLDLDDYMTGVSFDKIEGGKETMLASLEHANEDGFDENCFPSAIAGYMRSNGDDVTALNLTDANRLPMHDGIKRCFKGATILKETTGGKDHSMAQQFAKSKEDAAALLKEKFGDNASGIVGINWTKEFDGGGHGFNWKIVNGHVIFSDYQNGFANDNATLNKFWNMNAIDGNKYICIARLDGTTPRKGLTKFVRNRSKAA